MGFSRALAFLAVVLPAGAQDGTFESSEYGIRLRLPPGWNIDATRQRQVILKLTFPREDPFRPELIVSELLFPEEHITLGQYREQIRQFIQRTYRDPRLLDDRSCTVGGRPAFVLTVSSRTATEAEAISFRSFVELSPSRLLSVECVVPKGTEPEMGKAFDDLLASIEFIPRRPPSGTEEGLQKLAEMVAKLPATDAAFERRQELEYLLGDRKVGKYVLELRFGTRDDASGIEVRTADLLDLGPETGKLEKKTTAFLSDDLAHQWAQVEVIHVGRERRTQYFTAEVALRGGEATIERRVNGERSSVKLKTPERTVLLELLDALLFRLVASGRGPASVPALRAFDNDAGYLKVDFSGRYEMKGDDGKLVDVFVTTVQPENGTLMTFWHDAERRLVRRTASGQGIVLRAKK